MISLQRWAWAALASGVAACSYYDSSLLEPTGQISKGDAGKGGEAGGKGGKGGSAGDGGLAGKAGSGDGGAGQGGSAGGAGSAGQAGSGGTAVAPSKETQVVGCTLKAIGPPKTPPAKKDGVEIALAVRSIDFGGEVVNGKPKYKSYGLDLDGYCSCPADFSCKGSDTNNPNRYCDSENGLDNAAGDMVSDFAKLVPTLNADSINQGLEGGTGTLVLQIRGYNGEANDDQVELTLLATANTKIGAKWDGSDEWPIQKSSFDDAGKPLYVDANAYVTDHVLVATVLGGKLRASNISVELTSPLLFAALSPPDGQSPLWRIDSGNIAARWKTQNILAQLAFIKDPLSSQYFCTNNPLYGNFKSQICVYADIPSTTQSQPNIPCDAISLGLRFRAVQGKVGAVKDVPDDPPNCAPEFDPGKDSCK